MRPKGTGYFLSTRKADGAIDRGILFRMYGPLIIAVMAIAAGISFLFYSTVIYDSRETISQDLFLHERYLFHNPRDVTLRTCNIDLPCVWASASDESTVMKFESKEDARLAANSLPNSRQSNWLVIRFHPNKLTDAEKVEFMKVVDGIYHSEDAWFD